MLTRGGILLDTNILLVYLVGLTDKQWIPHFKRTNSYTPDDFDIIDRVVKQSAKIIVTLQILAELGNLWPSPEHTRARRFFSALLDLLKPARECLIGKEELLPNEMLPSFGFTDLSIVEAAKKMKCVIVTCDFRLVRFCEGDGCMVINFQHLRNYSWSKK